MTNYNEKGIILLRKKAPKDGPIVFVTMRYVLGMFFGMVISMVNLHAEPIQDQCCGYYSIFIGYTSTNTSVSNQYSMKYEDDSVSLAGLDFLARRNIGRFYADFAYLSNNKADILAIGSGYDFDSARMSLGYKIINGKRLLVGMNAGFNVWKFQGRQDQSLGFPKSSFNYSGTQGTYGVNAVFNTGHSAYGRIVAINYQRFLTAFGHVDSVIVSIGLAMPRRTSKL